MFLSSIQILKDFIKSAIHLTFITLTNIISSFLSSNIKQGLGNERQRRER